MYRKSRKFIIKVVEKLMSFNEDKYIAFRQSIGGYVKEMG